MNVRWGAHSRKPEGKGSFRGFLGKKWWPAALWRGLSSRSWSRWRLVTRVVPAQSGNSRLEDQLCVCESLSHVRLCNTMDCSLPGSPVSGIIQARILEWVAMSFSRGSSWPRDRTQVSCTAGRWRPAGPSVCHRAERPAWLLPGGEQKWAEVLVRILAFILYSASPRQGLP